MDEPNTRPAGFDVIAIVASLGGLNAVNTLLSDLPSNLPAAVLVLQHLEPNHPSVLARILGQHTNLTVKEAQHGDRLQPGLVFVAPPDRHLLVDRDGILSLTQTERIHFVRPSADQLLGSVARGFGRRAIAVVLTGSGKDGAEGARLIKQMGGTVIAQDFPTSLSFGMPGAAIHTGCVDHVLPLGEIAPTLVHLVRSTTQP